MSTGRLIPGKCRHLRKKLAVSMRSIVARATCRFVSEHKCPKKTPTWNTQWKVKFSETSVSNYWSDGWPAKCNKFHASPVISSQKKAPNKLYFRHYGTMQKCVFLVFTPVTSGLNVVLHVDPSLRSFCDSFSSSQEGHFTSVDRFKWHHSGANLPNEPSCYHGKNLVNFRE